MTYQYTDKLEAAGSNPSRTELKLAGNILTQFCKKIPQGFVRILLLILLTLLFCSPLHAQGNYTVVKDPATNASVFVFTADRGDVRFNHDLHRNELKAESCIPCHKTKTPTKEHTMTRFDHRIAHYFCKGCHREIGRGPVECHECHSVKK